MDWSRAARRPSDRQQVLDWIYRTAGAQETAWVEWKTGYDLTAGPGRLAVARQIIGMANRHPDRATTHCEGLAYLILGLEPNNAPGIEEHDTADLENWISPYVGDKIAWNPVYEVVDGVNVLFITIEPPRWGDDIHALRQGGADSRGKDVPEGTIFVRKLGKTERPTAADIDMLTERARRASYRYRLSPTRRKSSR